MPNHLPNNLPSKTIKLVLGDIEQAQAILGENDSHLRLLEQGLAASIVVRGNEAILSGSEDELNRAQTVLKPLISMAALKQPISPFNINYALGIKEDISADLAQKLAQAIYTTPRGKAIKPKTLGQWQYLQAIAAKDIVFGIGAAGTGKTYLAVAAAVAALKQRKVQKIILARPAVEAGEKLGFLPGDLQDKVNPYLRPIHDALDDTLGHDATQKYMERGIIEIAPLAYMRGRTLDEAFIILDEAQNTTPQQMKMFLTRLGIGSQAVITGDITQIDLPNGQVCGLIEAEKRLRHIGEIGFCYLGKMDIVRHRLVQKIIAAYED